MYKNYQHYIEEGWSERPKQSFVHLAKLVRRAQLPSECHCLDIGCATGELIKFLSSQFRRFTFVGIDVFDDLLNVARKLQPQHTFLNISALSIAETMKESFDLLVALGVMSIFDELTLVHFWNNLFTATKPGGKIIILSPLNEFGVDAIIKHRKRVDGLQRDWETGWNIFSIETISELLNKWDCEYSIEKFQINMELPPKKDPIRTWTITTATNQKQLTNGLKLLVDHYFIEVIKK